LPATLPGQNAKRASGKMDGVNKEFTILGDRPGVSYYMAKITKGFIGELGKIAKGLLRNMDAINKEFPAGFPGYGRTQGRIRGLQAF
jgi:hypothetical protein